MLSSIVYHLEMCTCAFFVVTTLKLHLSDLDPYLNCAERGIRDTDKFVI